MAARRMRLITNTKGRTRLAGPVYRLNRRLGANGRFRLPVIRALQRRRRFRDAGRGTGGERVPRLVSVGECIVELFGDIESGYRLRFEGAAVEMAKRMRGHLGADWSIDLFTALGDDFYSQKIVDDLVASGVGTSPIFKVAGRNVGLSLVGDPGERGPRVTNWRSQSAARLMADDVDALAAAFADADLIFASGAAFAILAPRARGRLLKALHRARNGGARIVLYPLEWPDLWTSRRVLGSAINTIATVADAVFTPSVGEHSVFGDASAEAIAARYHTWGVEEVLLQSREHGVFLSTRGGGRWIEAGPGQQSDDLNSGYLAARLSGLEPEAAARRLFGQVHRG